MHYAREVFERHNLDADQTIAGGPYVDLGGFRNFIHRQKPVRSASNEMIVGDDRGYGGLGDGSGSGVGAGYGDGNADGSVTYKLDQSLFIAIAFIYLLRKLFKIGCRNWR